MGKDSRSCSWQDEEGLHEAIQGYGVQTLLSEYGLVSAPMCQLTVAITVPTLISE